MSRKKRKLAPGQVQASARAVVWLSPYYGGWQWGALGRFAYWPAFAKNRARFVGFWKTREECVEEIKAFGFGAYTCEGKTFRLRSRYVAGDRPPPGIEAGP
jgi:hypothetical protein